MRRIPILLLIILLCRPVSVHAAATLRGVVRNSRTAKPVGFVNVFVSGTAKSGERVARGIMTLPDGRFIVAAIPDGTYTVKFSRVGFDVRQDSLRVVGGGDYVLDVVLAERPVEMPAIVVEGDRYQGTRDVQPGFIDVSAEVLDDLPGVVENDPIRALLLLPGVSAASDFTSGLYIRGGGPDQTLVLLDKVTVYNPSHAFGFFSTFNSDALGEMRLFKGAYPARFGGRLGAVLEADTRAPVNEAIRGKAALSTIAGRVLLEGPAGAGSWMVSARRTYLEPFLDAIRNADNDIPNYYFYDVNARLTRPAAGGVVTLSGYAGRDRLRLALDADNALSFNWGNALGSVSWRRAWSDRAVLDVRGTISEYTSGSAVRALTTPVRISNGITDVSAGADLTVSLGETHRLGVGLLASRFDVRYKESFNEESQVDYHRKPTEGAAYAEDEWMLPGEAVVKGGVRARYIDDGSRWLFEPRLSATRPFGRRWRARIGAGVYHQYLQLVTTEGLSAVDFYVPIDESADAARSWQVTGGVEIAADPEHSISVEGYYTGLTDLLTLNNDLAAGTPVRQTADVFYTGGAGYATGVELLLRKRNGAVTGWIGYTLGWTRRRWREINEGRTFPPKFDRRHDINAAVTWRVGGWKLGSAFVLGSGQAFTPAAERFSVRNPATGKVDGDALLLPADRNSARLLPYNRLDISAARGFSFFGFDAEWNVQVFNLYSRRNEWFINYTTNDNNEIDADMIRMLPIIPSVGVKFWF